MNYEQKYKEAMSFLKDLRPHMSDYCKEKIDGFFPELKESEDEQSKKWILEYLYDGLRKSDEQFKDQFKSAIAWLEKQGEQKSWSEDDEKMLDSIIDCIDGLCFIDSDQLNWLKSIKPNHWKPSEEQMKALETTIHISNFGLDIDRLRMLESLYNDLKKL